MIEWESDNVTILESSLTTPLCASVVNPQTDIPTMVQLPVRSMNITANGNTSTFLACCSVSFIISLCFNIENEDYFPIMEELSFMVVTGNRQCINVSVIDDTILENDDVFLIEAIDTTLVTPIQSSVKVTIANDDSK